MCAMVWTRRVEAVSCAVIVAVGALLARWLNDKDAWGALGQWAGAFGAVRAATVALRISRREAEDQSEL